MFLSLINFQGASYQAYQALARCKVLQLKKAILRKILFILSLHRALLPLMV